MVMPRGRSSCVIRSSVIGIISIIMGEARDGKMGLRDVKRKREHYI
jgi:hypothetical protein